MKKTIIATLLLITTIHVSQAQTIYNLGGNQYEAIHWDDTNGFFYASNGTSLQGSWSGGNVSFGGSTHLKKESDDDFDFTGNPYSSIGADYEIFGVDEFRVNGGEAIDGSPEGGNRAQDLTFSSTVKPTRILYYIGINDPGISVNGLKYAKWDFSTSDTETTFQVLGNTQAFTISNNGTDFLSWTTTGTDNNASSVLVEITNINGIGNFHIETNRLDSSGNNIAYKKGAQAADFQPVAILVQVPEPASISLLGLGAMGLLIRRQR